MQGAFNIMTEDAEDLRLGRRFGRKLEVHIIRMPSFLIFPGKMSFRMRPAVEAPIVRLPNVSSGFKNKDLHVPLGMNGSVKRDRYLKSS